MIEARKSRAFNFLARRVAARALRKRFHGVYLAGGEHLAALDGAGGVIGCVNHTNWWDGFVLYVLSHRRLPHEIYLAMDARNLRRYQFFRRMGVFGVDLTPGSANIAAVRYAIRLLRQHSPATASLIWMFVQGELVSERRPVVARPGATFLAGRAGACLLPVALRYAWLTESRPSVFIRVGPALAAGASPSDMAATLNALLAQTDQSLDPPDLAAYEPLLIPTRSIHTRWDDFRRALGWREVFDKFHR